MNIILNKLFVVFTSRGLPGPRFPTLIKTKRLIKIRNYYAFLLFILAKYIFL